MREIFLLLFLLTSSLFSFELRLNSGVQDKGPYEVMHIENDEAFMCDVRKNDRYEDYIVCSFDKVPPNALEDANTTFFDIHFDIKKTDFNIVIEPKFSYTLKQNYINLKDETEILPTNDEKFEHWIILGYRDNPPFIDEKKFEGINFPVVFPDIKRPYVGALDFNGKPIVYSKSNDLNAYIEIKKEYLRKGYDKVVTLADQAIKRYNNSIFTKELVLYKLKALDSLSEQDKLTDDVATGNDIIEIAQKWIKAFPSDDNLPEVLLILSKAYLKLGYRNDANYYFDVLVSEHPDSKYARLGILYFADALYKGRDKKKAIGLYKDVYLSAEDLDVASQAAIRLAKVAIDKGDLVEAKDYYDKILSLNSKFVLDDLDDAYKLANDLAAKELYELAANIGEKVLEKSTKLSVYHEDLLRDVGVWYDKAGLNEKAYHFYKEYQLAYRYGVYTDLIQNNLDLLFFKLKDDNQTKQLEHYDYVIQNYEDKEIYNKAIEEKAKLLYALKRYDEADALRDSMKDTNVSEVQTFNDISKQLIKNYLDADDCTNAVDLYVTRNAMIEENYDEKLYECLMRVSEFGKAKELFDKNINQEDLTKKAYWMAKGVKLFVKQSDAKNALALYDDLTKISKKANFDTSPLLYDIFYMHEKLDDLDSMINVAKEIKDVYPNEFKNIPVYEAVASRLQKKMDDVGSIGYYKDAVMLQKRFKKYTFSPTLELSYIESLKRTSNNEEAYSVAKDLSELSFDDDKMSRVLYVAGDLAIKQNDNTKAKEFFDRCTSLKVESSWKNLCESGKSLLK